MMSVTFCKSEQSNPYIVVRDTGSTCDIDELEIRIRVLLLAARWLEDEMTLAGKKVEN
jgi:hypothetical protein